MRNILAIIIIISIIFLIGVGCSTQQTKQQPKDISICDLEVTHPDVLACIRDASLAAKAGRSEITFEEIVCACKYRWVQINIPGLINER